MERMGGRKRPGCSVFEIRAVLGHATLSGVAFLSRLLFFFDGTPTRLPLHILPGRSHKFPAKAPLGPPIIDYSSVCREVLVAILVVVQL